MNSTFFPIWATRLAAAFLPLLVVPRPVWSQGRYVYKLDQERQHNFVTGGTFIPLAIEGTVMIVRDNQTDEPLLVRFAQSGEAERIALSIPEAHRITIYGVSSGVDGSIVATGAAYNNDGRGTTFLVRIQPDRKRQTVTQVWPYVPKAIALAPDGTLWSIGWIREGAGISHYNVLKRFDVGGKLLDTRMLKARGARIAGDDSTLEENHDAAVFSSLRASNNRIGWMTNGNEYIEFSLDANEVERIKGPPNESPTGILALSADNAVVTVTIENKKPGFWKLDRMKRRWTPAELTGGDKTETGLPLGFAGEALLTTTSGGLVRVYKSVGMVK